MAEENLIDIVCNRLKFDKDKLEKGELGKIEVDSFNLTDFWTQFGVAVQSLSNEVTKICFTCGKTPFPKRDEVDSMLQGMFQYYTLMKDLFLVLPKEEGAVVYKSVTDAVFAIISALLDIVHSLNDLSEKGAKSRLTLTGTFWDACNAVESLPKNNLQATVKVIEDECALAADAREELNTVNEMWARTSVPSSTLNQAISSSVEIKPSSQRLATNGEAIINKKRLSGAAKKRMRREKALLGPGGNDPGGNVGPGSQHSIRSSLKYITGGTVSGQRKKELKLSRFPGFHSLGMSAPGFKGAHKGRSSSYTDHRPGPVATTFQKDDVERKKWKTDDVPSLSVPNRISNHIIPVQQNWSVIGNNQCNMNKDGFNNAANKFSNIRKESKMSVATNQSYNLYQCQQSTSFMKTQFNEHNQTTKTFNQFKTFNQEEPQSLVRNSKAYSTNKNQSTIPVQSRDDIYYSSSAFSWKSSNAFNTNVPAQPVLIRDTILSPNPVEQPAEQSVALSIMKRKKRLNGAEKRKRRRERAHQGPHGAGPSGYFE